MMSMRKARVLGITSCFAIWARKSLGTQQENANFHLSGLHIQFLHILFCTALCHLLVGNQKLQRVFRSLQCSLLLFRRRHIPSVVLVFVRWFLHSSRLSMSTCFQKKNMSCRSMLAFGCVRLLALCIHSIGRSYWGAGLYHSYASRQCRTEAILRNSWTNGQWRSNGDPAASFDSSTIPTICVHLAMWRTSPSDSIRHERRHFTNRSRTWKKLSSIDR